MELTVDRKKLTSLLQLIAKVTTDRQTMPILANVRLDAAVRAVDLGATDLEVSVMGSVDATVHEPGSITLDAKMFLDVVKAAPSDEIRLRLAKGARVEVFSGKSKFKLNGVSSDEYPTLAGIGMNRPISLPANVLFDALAATAYAASTDPTRYNINGVLFEFEGDELRLVATDGHRLAVADIKTATQGAEKVIVPRSALDAIEALLSPGVGVASLGVADGLLSVSVGDTTIAARLIDGEYPDYRKVIPSVQSGELEVDRKGLMAALKRVAIVATDKAEAVKLKPGEGVVSLASSSPEHGEATDDFECVVHDTIHEFGLSSKYILDALGTFKAEKLHIELSGEHNPVMVSSEFDDHFAVIMPMRFD